MSIVSKARVVSAVLTLAFLVTCTARPANAQVTRLVENSGYAGGEPFFTSNFSSAGGAGGAGFYSTRITVPANANTLLIDLSGATTFQCDDESFALFTCLIDGNLCVPQAINDFDDAPTGWITLNALSSEATNCDRLFNTIHMTWCVPPGRYTTGGTMHTIVLRMASGDGNVVILQPARVTVDAVKVSDTSNACTGKNFAPAVGIK